MNPYVYCHEPHIRKHEPVGYDDYRSFKPWLRDEFAFRCFYCLHREQWCQDGDADFGVDHVRPKSSHPDIENEYTNLVYACCRCNSFKGDQDLDIDLTTISLASLLRVDLEGRIHAKDAKGGNHLSTGEFLIEALQLNRPRRVEFRKRLIALLMDVKTLFDTKERRLRISRYLGFPPDLPNLNVLAPPSGNAKRGSEQSSCYARRVRRLLPSNYFCCGI
jgi:hypothetical protein